MICYYRHKNQSIILKATLLCFQILIIKWSFDGMYIDQQTFNRKNTICYMQYDDT